MKLNIATKNADKTLRYLRQMMSNEHVSVDLIRVYDGGTADYDVQSDEPRVFSLELLNELTPTLRPWDIRIY